MTISREKMINLDKNAIEKYKIPAMLLVENTAIEVFNKINIYNSYTIVCGSGSNGADGAALARHLLIANKDVDVFLIKDAKSKSLIENLEILKNLKVNIKYINKEEDLLDLVNSLEVNEVCVDSIFGTGLTREIKGLYKNVIEEINLHSNYIISIDIPSGIDADTGIILGSAIRANQTITVFDIKEGMVDNDLCGNVSIAKIGIPKI